jgi:hypothetical protein
MVFAFSNLDVKKPACLNFTSNVVWAIENKDFSYSAPVMQMCSNYLGYISVRALWTGGGKWAVGGNGDCFNLFLIFVQLSHLCSDLGKFGMPVYPGDVYVLSM